MKIVAVLGSPRAKSNSSALAGKVLEIAAQSGAETQEFVLNQLTFQGCQACESCKKKTDRCVLKDGLTPVLEAVRDADAVVFATPNYFGEVSGQFKCFFDRTYSYLNPDFSSRLQPGKRAVFIMAQGQADPTLYADVYPRYDAWLTRYGFTQRSFLRMNGPRDADSLGQRPDLASQAEQIGRNLMA
jgi:multimeric flavodoxin WrbA